MKPLQSFLTIVTTVLLTIVLSHSVAQAKPPVLKIYGKESPDVYLQSLDIQVEVTGTTAIFSPAGGKAKHRRQPQKIKKVLT
jgi:hypothetical protein